MQTEISTTRNWVGGFIALLVVSNIAVLTAVSLSLTSRPGPVIGSPEPGHLTFVGRSVDNVTEDDKRREMTPRERTIAAQLKAYSAKDTDMGINVWFPDGTYVLYTEKDGKLVPAGK